MSYVSYAGGTISSAQIAAAVGPNTFDLKYSVRNFQTTLLDFLTDYADPNKGMTIGGHYFTAAEKTGPAATLLMSTEVTQMEDSINTLVNVWTSLFTLEKGIGGTSG